VVSTGGERAFDRLAAPFGSTHDAFGFMDGLVAAHFNPAGHVNTGITTPFVERTESGSSRRQPIETMLRLVDVAKRYGTIAAIDGVSLELPRGEIVGVIGRSGAGKSTLIRCLNGLEKPDSGRIEILGQDIVPLGERALRRVRGRMGMIFQHFNLLASKTVADNVALPLKIAGRPGSERRARVAALLALVGLEDKASAYPAQLSGGQKQRVGIARALAADPALLLSDEATSALDPETTATILTLLRDINRKLGLTIILITHEMSVVRAIADRVIVLDEGRIAEVGLTTDVFTNPQAELTRRLLAPTHQGAPVSNLVATDRANGLLANWAPDLDAIFRVTLEGELVDRPALADLTQATGARPVILRAGTRGNSNGAARTIVFSIPGATPELVAKTNRYLTRIGATLEILGYAQPAA
jgi:D-methionine transport system ATP-binding protein